MVAGAAAGRAEAPGMEEALGGEPAAAAGEEALRHPPLRGGD